MTARSSTPLLLVGLVLLAGCGGLASSDAPGSHDTATPAPVPTVSPTPTRTPGAVPGVSARGVASPFNLANAHRAVLSNWSYTKRTVATERFANGSLRRRMTAVVRVVPAGAENRSRYLRETTFEGPIEPTGTLYPAAARIETYGADRAYVRVTYPNGTTTTASFRRLEEDSRTLAVVVAAFETRIAGRTPCGARTCHVVRSTALETPRYLAGALVPFEDRTVTGGSLVALVDGRGLVHEYRVRYTVETHEGTYTAARRVRYAEFGDTEVERPTWVANATVGRPTG